MAISEDIRNLYKEFGGHVEGYVEFEPRVSARAAAARAAAQRATAAPSAPVAVAPAQAVAPTQTFIPVDDHGARDGSEPPLGTVFARLAGRPPER